MVSSLLSVTKAASDRSLLTIGQLRAAIGASGNANDVALRALEPRVASALTRRCGVRADGAIPPTLRLESLLETFRLERIRVLAPTDFREPPALVLSRRPVVTLRSVTEDGTVLDPTDYELDAAAAMLYRLRDDRRTEWCAQKVVLDYDAGWATLPDGLALAAVRLVKHFYDLAGQESNVQLEVSDISGRVGYFHGPNDQSALPADVEDLLAPYKNLSF